MPLCPMPSRLKLFRQTVTCPTPSRLKLFRLLRVKGQPCLDKELIVFVEAADMVIPEGEINRLNDADRHRISICHDWFSDPGFINGKDAVILVAESRSLVNHRIARLPQVIEVKAPSPTTEVRRHFINWFENTLDEGESLDLWDTKETLSATTAGLSIHALHQLLKGSCYEHRALSLEEVVVKVEEYIQQQLGDDVVEFKKPTHDLRAIVGFEHLKSFLTADLIPRIKEGGESALSGAAVSGPIGVGKTFIFEAVANELDMVVLVLKNIRSQWFGQTDVIFERLRRMMDALDRVLVFIDEADTQFGGIGPNAHSTERRLTGKIQQMMSDPQLKGRVTWLLMTARIHLLSPDIRRPGRVGDLIIPVLDPEGQDRQAFIDWVLKPVLKIELSEEQRASMKKELEGYSAASFSSLRSELKAVASRNPAPLTFDDVLEVVRNILPPAIGDTRRYQTLQALANCTRRSLLPDPTVSDEVRQSWIQELRILEARGIS